MSLFLLILLDQRHYYRPLVVQYITRTLFSFAANFIPDQTQEIFFQKAFFSNKHTPGLQGGLIGLAAVTVGLTSEAAQHLEVGCLPHDQHCFLSVFKFVEMCYQILFEQ